MEKRSAIVLINPKFAWNVGAVVRLSAAYGIDDVIYTGDRVEKDIVIRGRLPREERMKGYAEVDWKRDDRPLQLFPDLTPVAIEVREFSEPLHTFVHPERAVYVFGPEDGSLGKEIVRLCHRFVVIPTHHCLNLATAVATVLWDRYFKLQPEGHFITPGIYEVRGYG